MQTEEKEMTENEKKKEYLRQYRIHVRRIHRINAEIAELRSMKISPSMNNDGMPHGSSQGDLSGYAAELDRMVSELIKERYVRMVEYQEIVTCAGYDYPIWKKKRSSEVIHLKYDNARIRLYLQNVVGQYDRTLDAVNAMMRMSSMPRFKLKLGTATLSFREKQADGTDKEMTKDQYVKKIKSLLYLLS